MFLRLKQQTVALMTTIAEEIRKKYEYVRQDGTVGMRLQGMRELIAAMYWLEHRAVPPGIEVTVKSDSENGIYCTGRLINKEETRGIANKVVCKLDEHRVEGDPYWEKMPIARLKQVTEARLYRLVYPLIFSGYAEIESDIQPSDLDMDEQPQPIDMYRPPVIDEYLSQIGDLECLVTVYEDGEILKKTDPEVIKDAHERGVYFGWRRANE